MSTGCPRAPKPTVATTNKPPDPPLLHSLPLRAHLLLLPTSVPTQPHPSCSSEPDTCSQRPEPRACMGHPSSQEACAHLWTGTEERGAAGQGAALAPARSFRQLRRSKNPCTPGSPEARPGHLGPLMPGAQHRGARHRGSCPARAQNLGQQRPIGYSAESWVSGRDPESGVIPSVRPRAHPPCRSDGFSCHSPSLLLSPSPLVPFPLCSPWRYPFLFLSKFRSTPPGTFANCSPQGAAVCPRIVNHLWGTAAPSREDRGPGK